MNEDHTHDERRRAWNAMSGSWLLLRFSAIADQAKLRAHGNRGVLDVIIDMPIMAPTRIPPTVQVPTTLRWIGAVDFIAMMKESAAFGPETIGRWAALLDVMDPTRDVALFLHSTPASDDSWFSRFLVALDAHVAIH